MNVILFVSLATLVHAYVGYPLSLCLIQLMMTQRRHVGREGSTQDVSLVISAFNEESVIRNKIENSLAIDYPKGCLRIVVVSDGSTDGTDAIVREYEAAGVELRRTHGRRGKVACLNDIIPEREEEIIVMSDANSMYAPDGLKKLIRHFDDRTVGCVCGRLSYENPHRLSAGESEKIYWGYEHVIKLLESALGCLLGANGAMYAFRRRLFRRVDPLMFCDDVIPIRIAIAGYRTVYDPEAHCTEKATEVGVELRRRRRHASFGMRSMTAMIGEALQHGQVLIAYECISHRIVRWFGGFALLGILCCSPFAAEPLRSLLLGGEAVFYGLASIGVVASRAGWRMGLLHLPYYYLVITVAGMSGLWSWLRGSDRPSWEPRQ
jgi:cellulose synthase/poly-beta-1,6-N-acetylglucosamine synthase-like glycosyltransferase